MSLPVFMIQEGVRLSEEHMTDEEIAGLSGSQPRFPPGIPQAYCLKCGVKHLAFYAAMAHDCHIDMTARRPYADWLLDFQKMGYGVLQSPSDKRFPRFDYEVSGRQMLTFHLQADLNVGPGWELRDDWYFGDPWMADGFPKEL